MRWRIQDVRLWGEPVGRGSLQSEVGMRQPMRLPRRKPAMRDLARARCMDRHPTNRKRRAAKRGHREKVAAA